MASGYLGSPSGNTIVPVVNLFKQTKMIPLTASDITLSTGLSSLSFKSGYVVCRMDSGGNWKATGNVTFTATYATTNSFALTFNSLTAKSTTGYQQPVQASTQAGDISAAYWITNTTTVALETVANISGTDKYTFIDFDVWLQSEPTTYTTAANMENSQQVAAYIPSASASSAGLVDLVAQTFTGVKTFNSHSKFTATLDSNYTISNNTLTELGTSTQTWTASTGSTTDFNAATGRFQPTAAGLYFVGVQIDFASVGAGKYVLLKMLKSGSDTGPDRIAAVNVEGAIGAAYGEMLLGASGLVYLNGSEYVSAHVTHNYGSDRNIYGAETRFYGFRLS